MEVKPYQEADKTKKQEVREMFNNIAHRYDFLNHYLSLGIDFFWRNRLLKALKKQSPSKILDMATGTGDVAILLAKKMPNAQILGIDIADKMLDVARHRARKTHVPNVEFVTGEAENIDAKDNSFDAATVAFGVRNFENVLAGLKEFRRVIRAKGSLYILEFSKPQRFPVKQLFGFYFKHILPPIGKFFSKDAKAYNYLHDSVEAFPYGTKFAHELQKAGFEHVKINPLTFGICTLYIAS